MRILALDTSSSSIGIGYSDGEKTIERITTPDPKSHNKTILAEIDRLLTEQGITIEDIDYFAVVIGPGSFTGIRIGVATVNALVMATKKPIVEMTSLEVMAQNGDNMVLLDCKHNNYYVGIFQEGKAEYKCMKKEESEAVLLPKTYVEGTYPKRMLSVAEKKISKGETVKRAKPFYIKNSSAETGE